MNTQGCLKYKQKYRLITKTQLSLLLRVFIPRFKGEHCCFRTPACRAGISTFRRKQTGNKKAHLLRKDMVFSSKKIEALVVLKPAHGPTPCHCFWKSDPFFPGSLLWRPVGGDKEWWRQNLVRVRGLNVRHEQTRLISAWQCRFHTV